MSPRNLQQAADSSPPSSLRSCVIETRNRPQLELGAMPSIPLYSDIQDPVRTPSYNAPASDIGLGGLQYLPSDRTTYQHIDCGRVSELADEIDFSDPSSSVVNTPSAIAGPCFANNRMGSQRLVYTQAVSYRSHGTLDYLPEVLNTAQCEPSSSSITTSTSADIQTTMIETNPGEITTESLQPPPREIAREQSPLPSKYPSRSTKHTTIGLQNQGPQETRMEGTPLLEHRMQGKEDWREFTEYDFGG